MKGQDRQSEGQFGFARRPKADPEIGSAEAASHVRLVHSLDDTAADLSSPANADEHPPHGAFRRAEPEPVQPAAKFSGMSWLARHKASRANSQRRTPAEMRAGDICMPDTAADDQWMPYTASDDEDDGWVPSNSLLEELSKRRVALALAGVIYLIGIAGLWSMVQTFDDVTTLPATPANDDGAILPPFNETIDLRDAKLDGFIRPKFRPDDLRNSGDVARSNLQGRT